MSPELNGLRVKFNVFELKQQLEIIKEKEISWAEIARASGIHANTLVNISRNHTRRVDLETLEKLYSFFLFQGLHIEIGDLFKVSRRTE